jgi:xylan 1,4-beta-xylosidase
MRMKYSSAVGSLLLAVLANTAWSEPVSFNWFEYTGRDAIFERPLERGQYRNPILAGFHPDPSITRAGERFYLVNSTFAYFPGIPVFESADLVHWKQIGSVIDRPSQLDFDGLGMSRGVFAPTIEFHAGTFYVLNTAVDSGGNFIVTARDAAGPWSEPVWLPPLEGGIDPSLFIDVDGKAYVLNNGPPPGPPRYDGHRAIWMQEFALTQLQLIGPRKVLLDGGVDISKKPIWIEGPHLYRRNGWYYLLCAEGGTGPNHSQVVLRARSPWGPFEPYSNNPILTQRDLPQDRGDPITNAGHADLVELPDGSWWASFLATRTYDRVHYNTGRETFLLPVRWQDDWPIILPRGQAIPYQARAPKMARASDQAPMTGNFTWRDDFDQPSLQPVWLQVRVPKQSWFDLSSKRGALTLQPLSMPLDGKGNPSFLARRQQHLAFDASTELEVPADSGVAAGLVAFQSEDYWYFFGVRRKDDRLQLFLEKKGGRDVATVAHATLARTALLRLKISGDRGRYSFSYAENGSRWQMLEEDADATLLSTEVAGGFVGAVIGPHARAGHARDLL